MAKYTANQNNENCACLTTYEDGIFVGHVGHVGHVGQDIGVSRSGGFVYTMDRLDFVIKNAIQKCPSEDDSFDDLLEAGCFMSMMNDDIAKIPNVNMDELFADIKLDLASKTLKSYSRVNEEIYLLLSNGKRTNYLDISHNETLEEIFDSCNQAFGSPDHAMFILDIMRDFPDLVGENCTASI